MTKHFYYPPRRTKSLKSLKPRLKTHRATFLTAYPGAALGLFLKNESPSPNDKNCTKILSLGEIVHPIPIFT